SRCFGRGTGLAMQAGMQSIRTVAWGLGALGLVALVACTASEGSPGTLTGAAGTGASGPSGGFSGTNGGSGTTGGSGTNGGAGTGAPVLPPEQEVESSYEVPISTGHFVWIANPTSGRVAYV